MPSISEDTRGVSPVLGVVLLVGITVVLAAVTASVAFGSGGKLHEPPSAAVDITEATFTQGQDCPGPRELAVDVTLSQLQRADTIYVLADGGNKEILWADPGPGDVGTTKRVANELVGNGGTDVDIGGGGDIAICPGDRETFRFFVDYDGQTLLLQKYTTG